jgi:subtilisin family serine protease
MQTGRCHWHNPGSKVHVVPGTAIPLAIMILTALPPASLGRLRTRAARWLLLALCALGAAAPVVAAPSGSVDTLVVRYRDGVADTGNALVQSGLMGTLGNALGLPFTVAGTTRDGALLLQLASPVDVDTARAALNRLRMDGAVLYANIAPEAAPPVTNGLPTNRLVVKFRDAGLAVNAKGNIALDHSRIAQLSERGGQPLAWVHGTFNGANVLQMMQRLPIGQVEAMAQQIALDPEVEYAEPDYIRVPVAVAAPTDPCYASASIAACNGGFQWDLFDPVGGINMQAAWNITAGAANVNVAVIDTGALFSHPDLVGRFVGGYDMIMDCAVANDGQPGPCTWSSQAPDTLSRDTDAADPGDWVTTAEDTGLGSSAPPYNYFQGCGADSSSWHGTHVAGTIAATPSNGIGIAGINWVGKVVPVRVLGKCGGYDTDIAAAMIWAAGGSVPGVPANANPARVLSLSLGGGGNCTATTQTAINTAIGLGAAVVVAAGNGNVNASGSSPGNCTGVVTVAATTQFGLRARYSNYGSTVEIAAPGGNADGVQKDILSTLNAGTTTPAAFNYVQYAGTSMATPHVSGVASLVFSVNPALTPAQMLAKLQTTARAFPQTGAACTTPTVQGSTCNCTTALCGTGILDAGAAVAAAVTSGTTIASSANPSVVGAGVTFTATVVGTAPTGTVNFTDGGTTFGSCGAQALSGSGNTKTATCTTSALAVGTHAIVAAYSGDGGNAATSSAPLSQVVNLPASTTTVASSLNPAAPGASVTFTATVTGSSPSGTVNFKDAAATFGGCGAQPLAGAGNVRTATCTTSSLTAGAHSIVASYSGDGTNAASSSTTLTQTINVVNGIVLTSSANPAAAGAALTLTATITGNNPTGYMVFYDGTATIAGCATASLVGSGNVKTATCTTSALAVGTHTLKAGNAGDRLNFGFVSNVVSQVISGAGPVSTTTAVASSSNPSTVGGSVTFTATVTGAAPTGTVNFQDGASSIAGCSAQPLSGAGNARTATCTTSALAQGTHNVTASYAGDAGNLTSTSAVLAQVVNAAGPVATTTVVASSSNPSTVGGSVTFTATVTGSAPTGTVNFKDGASSISGCSAQALSGAGNARTATCTTSALAQGTHNVTASYAGDAGNLTSTSAVLAQVVNAAGPVSTTTAVASSSNPSTVGGSVTFTATVTGAAPTGTVNFQDGASSIAGCSAQPLSGAGNARTATCTTSALAQGTHNVTASYGGDAGNLTSSSAVLAQVVNPGSAGATTTALGSTPNPSKVRQVATFTATVTGTSPTGTVAFKDGAVNITGCAAVALTGAGNARTATCSTFTLMPGSHAVTAVYNGDAGNTGSTSNVVTQVVTF